MDPGQLGDRDRLEAGLQQLRALGYLQSPAELFVARRVPTRGGAARSALAAGLWVGAGGGALLALLLWGTSLLASPALLDRPGESAALLLLLLVALALAGGVTVALLAWPALLWAGLGRRAWALRLILLPLVAIVLASYVADALGRHVLIAVARALWPGAVLVVAAVAAAAAAWSARLLLAMVAAAGMRRQLGPLGGLVGPARASYLWLSAFSVALALLAFGPYPALRPQARLDELPPPAVLGGTPAPLLVVAIEGLLPGDADHRSPELPLRALAGVLQHASPLSTQGAAAHPAAFWNEIATGQSAQRHGLSDASAALPLGVAGGVGGLHRDPVWATLSQHVLPGVGLARTRAADQRELLVPPVWEIAARAGRRCLAVNWWATYPAARHAGLEIASDRWFLRLWEGDSAALEDPLLRSPESLARFAVALPATAAGQDTEVQWNLRLAHAIARGDSLVHAFASEPVDGFAGLEAAWRLATRADAFHARLALQAVAQGTRDLVLLHLNGLDILDRRSHASASGWAGDPAAARAAIGLRDLQVAALDALLDTTLTAVQSAGGRVLVVGSAVRHRARTAWIWTPEPRRFTALPASVLQVAPVLLSEEGIAPASDMASPPGARAGAWELPRPATYGRRPAWTPPAPRAAADLEALRSLGYIGGD